MMKEIGGHMKKVFRTLLFPAAMLLSASLLAGCSSGTTTITPNESSQPALPETPSASATEEPQGEIESNSEEVEIGDSLGSRSEPLALGTSVTMDDGNGGVWEIKLGPSSLQSNEVVRLENQFNSPPPEGLQFASIEVSATYQGPETGNPSWDIDVAFVSAAGTTHKSFDVSVVGPEELSNSNELYEGGTAIGNVFIAVPSEDITKGTWRLSTTWGGQEVFFKAE
jgi:hypothetical protein